MMDMKAVYSFISKFCKESNGSVIIAASRVQKKIGSIFSPKKQSFL